MLIGNRGSNSLESEILFTPDQKIEYADVFFFDDEGVLNIHAKLVENPILTLMNG